MNVEDRTTNDYPFPKCYYPFDKLISYVFYELSEEEEKEVAKLIEQEPYYFALVNQIIYNCCEKGLDKVGLVYELNYKQNSFLAKHNLLKTSFFEKAFDKVRKSFSNIENDFEKFKSTIPDLFARNRSVLGPAQMGDDSEKNSEPNEEHKMEVVSPIEEGNYHDQVHFKFLYKMNKRFRLVIYDNKEEIYASRKISLENSEELILLKFSDYPGKFHPGLFYWTIVDLETNKLFKGTFYIYKELLDTVEDQEIIT